MATHSLRAALGLFGAPPSLAISTFRHKFWDTYRAHERAGEVLEKEPFRSVQTIISNLTWHAGAHAPEGGLAGGYSNPSGLTAKWNFKLQGVTHDDDFWYFSTEDDEVSFANIGEEGTLFKIPKALKLRDIDRDAVYHVRYPRELLEAGYHHIGDIDYFKPWDLIVAAVESGGAPVKPVVALFDRDLTFHGKALLSNQDEAPWCAIEPRTRLLVSSGPGYADPILLQFYRLDRPDTSSVKLEWMGEMALVDSDGAPMPAKGVQGGAFSENGHLYLAVQQTIDRSDGQLRAAGIRAFDLLTGRLVLWRNIDYKGPDAGSLGIGKEELEGLTLWDVDREYAGVVDGQEMDAGGRPHAPHGVHGQVHVPMQANGMELFFKHWGVPREEVDKL